MGSCSNLDHPRPVSGTRAVERALAVLCAFTDERPTRSLSSLAAELALTKSTTHRILSALEMEGFVSRTPGGKGYQLGPELIVLGGRALNNIDARGVARPELEHLARDTGGHVTLECLVGKQTLILDDERGRKLMGLGTATGTVWPAHATATGKVLEAFSDPILPLGPEDLVAMTPNTIVSWEGWERTLAEVRRQGYATNFEELEHGFLSVAAPVLDRNGRAIGAISVGGYQPWMRKESVPELVVKVRGAARRISRQLGWESVEENGREAAPSESLGTKP